MDGIKRKKVLKKEEKDGGAGTPQLKRMVVIGM